jgi:hypothetical protein
MNEQPIPKTTDKNSLVDVESFLKRLNTKNQLKTKKKNNSNLTTTSALIHVKKDIEAKAFTSLGKNHSPKALIVISKKE